MILWKTGKMRQIHTSPGCYRSVSPKVLASMIYYLHYHQQDPPQRFDEYSARLLIENRHEDKKVQVELWGILRPERKSTCTPGI